MSRTVLPMIDASIVEDFERDGVVCLRGVLPKDGVARLAGAIDRTVSNIRKSLTGYDITEIADAVWRSNAATVESHGAVQYDLNALGSYVRATGAPLLADRVQHDGSAPGHFFIDTSVWTRDEDFRSVALGEILPAVAGQLMRSTKINYFDDQVFVKQPFTRERTAFHQDMTYFNLTGEQICVMWIPVDRATRESGTMLYVRGSHAWGREFQPNLFVSPLAFPGAGGEQLPNIEGNFDQYDIVAFDVEPGDVIVHNVLTVHGSGGNLSPNPRRAASLRYCGDDVRYFARPGTPVQPHHRHNLRDGDVLDCSQFPVVWRSPSPARRTARAELRAGVR